MNEVTALVALSFTTSLNAEVVVLVVAVLAVSLADEPELEPSSPESSLVLLEAAALLADSEALVDADVLALADSDALVDADVLALVDSDALADIEVLSLALALALMLALSEALMLMLSDKLKLTERDMLALSDSEML